MELRSHCWRFFLTATFSQWFSGGTKSTIEILICLTTQRSTKRRAQAAVLSPDDVWEWGVCVEMNVGFC